MDSPLHKEFREKVKKTAKEKLSPFAKKLDKEDKFSEEVFRILKEEKLLGIPFPEKYGGLGLDTLAYSIAVEEVSRISGTIGIILAAHISLACSPIWIAGNEAQKSKWLTPLVQGVKKGAFGLTEPNAGSDAGGTETKVKEEGRYYIITGSKRFITSGSIGDIITITATHNREEGTHGISAFVIEKGTPGFTVVKEEDKLGLRGSITSELVFEECKIPKENLLGKEREGFKIFMKTLDGGRISIGAMAVGIAQGVMDEVVKYMKGKKRTQLVEGLLAEIATKIEAARRLVYYASKLKDEGKKVTKEAAMAKYYASEIGMWVCNRAIDILGVLGVTQHKSLERFLRDEKLTEIGEGTTEIQKIVIARNILK